MVRVTHITELIVDNGGYINILIHESKKAEEFLIKVGIVHEPIYAENYEYNDVLNIIKHLIEGGETDKWNKISTRCMEVSKENTS